LAAFDPALLVQARKRIAAATENLGDAVGWRHQQASRAWPTSFNLVAESMVKLHPKAATWPRR
jgi:hypothetical protein